MVLAYGVRDDTIILAFGSFLRGGGDISLQGRHATGPGLYMLMI